MAGTLLLTLDHPIIVRREQVRAQRAAAEAFARAERERRQRERAARGGSEASIVDEFNARHDLPALLDRYGYQQARGSDHWRSPYQTSKTYATRVYGEYWISLSSSDAENGLGRASKNGSSCFGDAFDLFVHFDRRGDFTAAVRAYAEEIKMYQGGEFAGGADFDWGRKAEGAEASGGANTEAQTETKLAWTAPDPRFLRAVIPPAPKLPLDDVFSPAWAAWLRVAADCKGAPVDYVAAALLSAAGALIGNTRRAAPWAGWSETAIIWFMAEGNPSAGKSPGLSAVLDALKRVERAARQIVEKELIAWRSKAEVARLVEATWKESVKAALKAGEAPPEKPREADPGPEPVLPRLAVNDATVEKLAVILSRQPRGLLMARDELSGLLGNMSRYSGGSDRPFWLEAYGGGGYNVERMGRDPIWIDHLSIGVVGGIQPDRLKSLLLKTDDDGLLARFIPVWPDPTPIKRPEAGIDEEFIDAALRKLLGIPMAVSESGEERPWYVPFTEEARVLLTSFRKEARDWEEGQEGLLLSFIGKLPGMAVRLALILAHLDWAAGGPDPFEITARHFARAAYFIDAYALPMARRAYADGSTPKEVRGGTKLAAIIIEQRWRRFTTSDVLRLNRAGLNTKAELDPILDALETGDLIRALTPKTEGRGKGRPSRAYAVNPALRSFK